MTRRGKEDSGISYASAGVDIEAGDRAVELFKPLAKRATRAEVRGGLGGFAGLFALRGGYREPVLAASTDGVGTKLAVAQAMDKHDTVGLDLVAMVVDDLVVCGAEPLFMTDYIATGKVVPERIAAIVSGIAAGCEQAGCALLGGETAEHPGLMAPDEYDVAGAGTAVVEADQLLGPDRVRAGDVVIAMASSGLHSNGYSLARKVLLEEATVDTHVPELGRTLGEELLEPTRIYTKDCLALADAGLVHAFSHVTGGGLASNLARVLPAVTLDDAPVWHTRQTEAWSDRVQQFRLARRQQRRIDPCIRQWRCTRRGQRRHPVAHTTTPASPRRRTHCPTKCASSSCECALSARPSAISGCHCTPTSQS